MKLFGHPALQAFGAATIILLVMLAPLASPEHLEVYHLSGPISSVLIPVLLNFVGVWFILALLLTFTRRHPRLDACFRAVLVIALLWMLMKAWYSFHAGPVPFAANLSFAAIVLVGAAAFFASRPRTETPLHHTTKLSATLLGFFALSGLVMLTEIFCFAWQARNLNTPLPLHHPTAATRHARILWIVLDELSYRQVYEHRFPGLQLPAFDQLAAQSTIFTHTIPAGIRTEVVLPSLFTGIPLDDIASPAAGVPLSLRNASTQNWQAFDPHQTVFQDALNAGYSTGIAGWYNPYCRILPSVLDRCYWISHIQLPGAMSVDQSILWNAKQPALHHLPVPARWIRPVTSSLALSPDDALHQQDYTELLAAGDKLLNDPSVSFLLLHMPIPHPFGIYNRRTASLIASHNTYIDNLALCDLYLTHLRQMLQRNGTWDQTTIVIMGDHSWRSQLWKGAPGWLPEEQAATDGGRFDDRPGYIVKLPGQTTSARIDKPFAALRTRELFNALFAGRITTPQQLATWASQPN